MRPAVFLDRDDTLMAANSLPAPPPPAAPGDVVDPSQVRLLPGVLEGCRRLRQAGFRLVAVTNQGVAARGGATLEQIEAVNARLRSLLLGLDGGPLLEAVYACPFHPRGIVPRFKREHAWRKPGPGMILAAARELGLDLRRSWLVGDAQRDIDAGVAAGLAPQRCLLLGPERGFATATDAVLHAPG
jgi:D-glycero-D-manno-heptose 1,7-bisphosphate phosphatase